MKTRGKNGGEKTSANPINSGQKEVHTADIVDISPVCTFCEYSERESVRAG